jgi:hypothetical protein
MSARTMISRKRLLATFPTLSTEQATDLHRALGQVTQWTNPKQVDTVLEIANTMLNGHGVEVVHDSEWSNYYCDIGLLFVNMGDSYAITLLFDTRRKRFYACSIGDYVESSRELRKRFEGQ